MKIMWKEYQNYNKKKFNAYQCQPQQILTDGD